MESDCEESCLPICENSPAFIRLRVRPTIMHGTHVEWLIHPQFPDPAPHTFQLQVGHTGSNLADDWQNVGLPAVNVSYLVDDTQRVFGKTQWTHYRVVLTTSDGTYISKPQHCLGDLRPSDWQFLLAREREWQLQLEKTHRGTEGYLLKRRLVGEAPAQSSNIIDYMTDEIVRPQAEETIGTEFLHGYYAPIPCVYAELDPKKRREKIDSQRGSVNDLPRLKATMLAVPFKDSEDIWVNKKNDTRWKIHEIDNLEEIRDVPIVVSVELRLLPFTHVAYKIPMP